jgi:hypothetical protein
VSAPIIPQRAQTPAASLINLSRRTVQPPCSVGAGEQLGADAAAPDPAMAFWSAGCAEWWTVDGHGYLGLSDDPVDEDRPRSRATDHSLYARPLPPTRRAAMAATAAANAHLDNICMT